MLPNLNHLVNLQPEQFFPYKPTQDQEKLLYHLKNKHDVVFIKARQVGYSSMLMAYVTALAVRSVDLEEETFIVIGTQHDASYWIDNIGPILAKECGDKDFVHYSIDNCLHCGNLTLRVMQKVNDIRGCQPDYFFGEEDFITTLEEYATLYPSVRHAEQAILCASCSFPERYDAKGFCVSDLQDLSPLASILIKHNTWTSTEYLLQSVPANTCSIDTTTATTQEPAGCVLDNYVSTSSNDIWALSGTICRPEPEAEPVYAVEKDGKLLFLLPVEDGSQLLINPEKVTLLKPVRD